MSSIYPRGGAQPFTGGAPTHGRRAGSLPPPQRRHQRDRCCFGGSAEPRRRAATKNERWQANATAIAPTLPRSPANRYPGQPSPLPPPPTPPTSLPPPPLEPHQYGSGRGLLRLAAPLRRRRQVRRPGVRQPVSSSTCIHLTTVCGWQDCRRALFEFPIGCNYARQVATSFLASSYAPYCGVFILSTFCLLSLMHSSHCVSLHSFVALQSFYVPLSADGSHKAPLSNPPAPPHLSCHAEWRAGASVWAAVCTPPQRCYQRAAVRCPASPSQDPPQAPRSGSWPAQPCGPPPTWGRRA